MKAVGWRALFGLATFTLLFLVLHPRQIVDALANVHLGYFGAGFGLCIMGLCGRAWRWMLILHHIGLRIPFWRVLEVYTISYWFNTFMPGNMGGDLYKMYDVSKASAKRIRPAAAVLAERVTGMLALLFVAIIALILFYDEVPVPPWILALILKGSVLLTGLLLMAILWFDACWPFLVRCAPFLGRRVPREHIERIGAVSGEMRAKPMLFVEAFVFGVLIQVQVLITYYVLALAITDKIPGIYFFTLFPLIEISSFVPITINGIGIREGLLVFSLRYADVGPEFAMGLGILYRIVALLLAMLGGLLLILRKPRGWTTDPRVE